MKVLIVNDQPVKYIPKKIEITLENEQDEIAFNEIVTYLHETDWSRNEQELVNMLGAIKSEFKCIPAKK